MKRPMIRPGSSIIALAISFSAWGGARADDDPLDKISGMENWRGVAGVDIEAEWRNWYRSRRQTRLARREQRLQRARNRRLASILRRAVGAARGEVRRIVRAPLRRRKPDVPTRWIKTGGDDDETRDRLQTKRRRRHDRDRTPNPPAWTRVPVERLDDRGQAVDTEGDEILRRATKKRRR